MLYLYTLRSKITFTDDYLSDINWAWKILVKQHPYLLSASDSTECCVCDDVSVQVRNASRFELWLAAFKDL